MYEAYRMSKDSSLSRFVFQAQLSGSSSSALEDLEPLEGLYSNVQDDILPFISLQ